MYLPLSIQEYFFDFGIILVQFRILTCSYFRFFLRFLNSILSVFNKLRTLTLRYSINSGLLFHWNHNYYSLRIKYVITIFSKIRYWKVTTEIFISCFIFPRLQHSKQVHFKFISKHSDCLPPNKQSVITINSTDIKCKVIVQ